MGLYLLTKHQSENCLEHVNLHDCSVTMVVDKGGDLLLEFEYIYILNTHPLITDSKAMYTDMAHILFKNYAVSNHVYYCGIGNDNTKAPVDFLVLIETFEVLAVDEMETADGTLGYHFFGNWWRDKACNFAEFDITCKKVMVGWDEFVAEAWFNSPRRPGEAVRLPNGAEIVILKPDE